MKNLNEKQTQLLQDFADAHPNASSFTRQEMFTFAEEQGVTGSTAYTMMKILPRIGRGVYKLETSAAKVVPMPTAQTEPVVQQTPVAEAVQKAVGKVRSTSSDEVFIPQKDDTIVRWVYFSDVLKIIKSKMFYRCMLLPCLTQDNDDWASSANREYVRVQIMRLMKMI